MFKRCGETDFNIMSSKNQSYILVSVVIKYIIVSIYVDRVSVKGHLSSLVDQQWDLSIIFVAECVPPSAWACVYACVCVCVLHLMSFQCLTWSVCRWWHMYTHTHSQENRCFCVCHDRSLAPSAPLTPADSLADPAEAVCCHGFHGLKEAHHPKLASWVLCGDAAYCCCLRLTGCLLSAHTSPQFPPIISMFLGFGIKYTMLKPSR